MLLGYYVLNLRGNNPWPSLCGEPTWKYTLALTKRRTYAEIDPLYDLALTMCTAYVELDPHHYYVQNQGGITPWPSLCAEPTQK